MNCSEFEKRIYLYRELTQDERKLTDEHIAHCQSCTALASRVFQQQEMIGKYSSVNATIKDADWLTQRIMNSIERKETRVSRFDAVTLFLDSLFVRYAFGVLSVLLISLFYIEQQEPSPVRPIAHVEIKHGAILNTSSFLKTHFKSRQQRETPLSISRYSYNRSARLVKL